MEWILFSLSALIQIVSLFLPGFLFLILFRVRTTHAVLYAPFFSVFYWFVATSLYPFVSIPASFYTLIALPGLLLLAIFLCRRIMFKEKLSMPFRKYRLAFLYCAVAGIGCFTFYLSVLKSPNSFVQLFDTLQHISWADSLAHNSNWSMFHPESFSYFLPGENPLLSSPQTGFYPPVWTWLVALPQTVLPTSATLGTNSAIFVVICIVFPMGIFGLITNFISHSAIRLQWVKRLILISAAFFAIAFTAFPWVFLTWGALYPNLLAFVLLPSALTFFLCQTQLGASRATSFVHLPAIAVVKNVLNVIFSTVLPFLLMLFVLLICQPNAVFTLGIFCACYICFAIVSYVNTRFLTRAALTRRLLCVVCAVLFLVFCACAWMVLYNTSIIEDVAQMSWRPQAPLLRALYMPLVLQLNPTYAFHPQYVLAFFLVVGLIRALTIKGWRWIVLVYLFFCFQYVLGASEAVSWYRIFTGFWYNDCMRLAAQVALVGIPLATLGFTTILQGAVRLLQRFSVISKKQWCLRAVSVGVCFCLLAPVFLITGGAGDVAHARESSFDSLRRMVARASSVSGSIEPPYGPEKQAFVRKVKEIVPDDAYIINNPFDGSAYAYIDIGLPTLYRSFRVTENESAYSRLLRDNADDIEHTPYLKDAMKAAKHTYLLQLNQVGAAHERWCYLYFPDVWRAIQNVNENTSGYKLILQEGDMKLFEVE